MKIEGLGTMGANELNIEIQRGGKFVVYQYTISVIIITFRRSSNIYFVKAGESAVGKGIPFILISLFLGWWGIPWGPIFTIGSLITNFRGGKDITGEIIQALNQGS